MHHTRTAAYKISVLENSQFITDEKNRYSYGLCSLFFLNFMATHARTQMIPCDKIMYVLLLFDKTIYKLNGVHQVYFEHEWSRLYDNNFT